MIDTFEEIAVIDAGKRLGVQWTPWMGDWFTSWSPRNDNNNAEGEWDQWVHMAVRILQHPATAITSPEAHAAVKDITPTDYYTGSNRELTEEELQMLFGRGDS